MRAAIPIRCMGLIPGADQLEAIVRETQGALKKIINQNSNTQLHV